MRSKVLAKCLRSRQSASKLDALHTPRAVRERLNLAAAPKAFGGVRGACSRFRSQTLWACPVFLIIARSSSSGARAFSGGVSGGVSSQGPQQSVLPWQLF